MRQQLRTVWNALQGKPAPNQSNLSVDEVEALLGDVEQVDVKIQRWSGGHGEPFGWGSYRELEDVPPAEALDQIRNPEKWPLHDNTYRFKAVDHQTYSGLGADKHYVDILAWEVDENDAFKERGGRLTGHKIRATLTYTEEA